MKWTKTQFAEIRDYLRRDSEFKKHYMRARGGTYGYRRSSIGDYLSPWLGVGRRRSLPVGLPAFAGHSDIEDRDQLRRYFDTYWDFPQLEINKYDYIPDWDDVMTDAEVKSAILDDLDRHEFVPPPEDAPVAYKIIPQPPTPEDSTMTDIIKITTKTLVNGVDVATMADSAIYDLIKRQENAIADLESIKNKPKKLKTEIAERQAGIAALVAYLDSKE